MDRYFTKFPTIQYSNVAVRDISRSVRLSNEARAKTTLFQPVEIKAGFRADSLADAYYEDSEMDWFIWLTNDIVDPFYQWYLSERDFENFITTKYGSLADAEKQIVYYRNNWASSVGDSITATYYNNNISPDLKRYWTPVFGSANKIIAYTRAQVDWVTTTNRIVEALFETPTFSASPAILTPDLPYTSGEILEFWQSGEIVGRATTIVSNSTSVTYQHCNGFVIANNAYQVDIVGQTGSVSLSSSNSYPLIENITAAEEVFWEPVSAYELEVVANESKKDIFLVDAGASLAMSEQFRLKLKDNPN